MKTTWVSILYGLKLEYIDGELKQITITSGDKVVYDAMRHYIELYEEDLLPKFFKKADND
jgi:hypothetical protein